jgi:hypothetical protein
MLRKEVYTGAVRQYYLCNGTNYETGEPGGVSKVDWNQNYQRDKNLTVITDSKGIVSIIVEVNSS